MLILKMSVSRKDVLKSASWDIPDLIIVSMRDNNFQGAETKD